MNFKIKFNKWSNFYFFVQNLSLWAAHCNEGYNKYWRNGLGDFTNEEKKLLEGFKDVRRRYRKSRSFFEYAFYKKEDPWEVLEEKLSSKDYRRVRDAFDVLEDKFDKIYSEELSNLEGWKEKLEKEIKKNKIKNIQEVVEDLYGIESFPEEITLYLLLSSPDSRGGDSYVDEESINLKISQSNESAAYILSLAWHEILHLLVKKSKFSETLRKLSFNVRFRGNILEYSITSLFPKGVLGERFFDVEVGEKERIRNDISSEDGRELIDISKKYIEEGRSFDENYIKIILEII